MSDRESEPGVESTSSLSAQLASLTKIVSQQQETLGQLLSRSAQPEHPEDGESVNSEDGNQSNPNDNDFDAMLDSITNAKDTDDSAAELADVLADVEKTIEYGSDIKPGIADAFIKTISRPLSKDTKEKLKKELLIPSNCRLLTPPKMNSEIWMNLPTRSRLADLHSQQVQQSLATGIATLATISDEIAKITGKIPKETFNAILKTSITAANILGNQYQEMNSKRKQAVKAHISSEYAGICSIEAPPGEFLFGSNLGETLKSTKATSALIRNAANSKRRYAPYTPRSASLNLHRPFQQQRGRWSGTPDRNRQTERQFPAYQQPRQQLLGRPNYHQKKN